VPVALEVRLVERLPDRARVMVTLTPRAAQTAVDGVTVELFTDECEALGNRVVLPIAGVLTDAITVRAEVRGVGEIPARAVIVATAWHDGESVRAMCPADPWTAFEAHVRGKRCVHCQGSSLERELESATRRDRERIAVILPWIGTAMKPRSGELRDIRDDIDEISAEMGLDASDCALLKEILRESE
jgi:hypothetical protein